VADRFQPVQSLEPRGVCDEWKISNSGLNANIDAAGFRSELTFLRRLFFWISGRQSQLWPRCCRKAIRRHKGFSRKRKAIWPWEKSMHPVVKDDE
jgi:hypothetical protein